MIKIKDLSFTYPGQQNPSLKNINLQINGGDFLAVIGGNGSGKSTLCKALNGLIPHFFDGDYSGEVEVCGLNTIHSGISELAMKIGYVYQDFENQIVRPTVLDDASFACLNYAMPDYEARGRKALEMTGLEHRTGDYIWQLSGGLKHLLALSGAISLSPDILILDEPIAHLDPCHAKKIYNTLKSLNENHGKTIIVIEHHTDFIAEYCKNVVILKDGQALWKKPAKEALNRIEELESCSIFPPQVSRAAKYLRDRNILPKQTELPIQTEEAYKLFSDLPRYIKKNAAGTLTADSGVTAADEILGFQNVSVSYRAVKGGGRSILRGFNCSIKRGEKIALAGSNGSGKSTVLKLAAGLLKPLDGTITLENKRVNEHSAEAISEKISLVYQNPEEMFIKDTIRGDIEYAMKARGFESYAERTKELLEQFDLDILAERDGRLLSGGQMRRASLAIGVALTPSVLLLDEPTANLDIATRKQITRTLASLKNQVETVIIATHDMQLVTEWANRIIVLCDGNIIADGTREEIFRDDAVREKAGILPPEIYRIGQLFTPPINCFQIQEFVDCFIPAQGCRKMACAGSEYNKYSRAHKKESYACLN
jgi:energy-coupling factor transport system ATP-binding protein